MKILIIDDEPGVREVLKQVLGIRDQGLATEKCPNAQSLIPDPCFLEAGDLRSALAQVREADVILCDGHFPTGGSAVSWEVGQNPWLAVWAYAKHKRFALCTGDGHAAERAAKLGIKVFLKPFRWEEIMEWVLEGAIPDQVGDEVNHENERAA